MDNKEMVCRINALLAERNISKTQFFADCGITSGAYSQWNTGKTSPTRKSLQRIAEYLGVKEDYLLVGKQQKKPPEIGELSAFEEKFIQKLRTVPDDRMPEVEAVLTSIFGLSAGQGSGGTGESSR
jgi:transcriptional regulator with XRE-family HTH domain